jgi:hypothetical protein
MPATPMLADLELPQVGYIVVDRQEEFARHGAAAVDGEILTGLGRRGAAVHLAGVLSGSAAADGLKDLRQRYRAAEPVPFTADITTATRVDRVLIQELTVREEAGHPERFHYTLVLRQYAVPPSTATEKPEPQATAADVDAAVAAEAREATERQVTQATAGQASLAVEVTNPSGDFSALAVIVEGTSDTGERVSLTLLEQQDGVYRRDGLAAGRYTVTVVRRGTR